MAEIASAASLAGTVTQSRASVAHTSASVEVALVQVPAKIATAGRIVEATGLLESAPTASNITLMTALGTIELTLSRLTSEREFQILQTLTSMYQRKTAITLVIAPDQSAQSGTKAALLLPGTTPSHMFPRSPEQSATASQSSAHDTILPETFYTKASLPSTPSQTTTSIRAIVILTSASSPSSIHSTRSSAASSSFVNANPSFVPPQLNKELNPVVLLPNAGTPSQLASESLLPASVSLLSNRQQCYEKTIRNALIALQDVRNAAIPTVSDLPSLRSVTVPSSVSQPTFAVEEARFSTKAMSGLTAGQEVFLCLSQVSMPEPDAAQTSTLQKETTGFSCRATLEAKGSDGQGILKSPVASFFVTDKATPLAKATIGSQWEITLASQRPPATAANSDVDAAMSQLQDTAALPEILATLSSFDAFGASTNSASLRFPVVGTGSAQLGASLLFFLNALKGSDLRGWLNDGMEHRLALVGKSRLINKFEEAIRKAVHEEESVNGDLWRACELPVSEHDNAAPALGYPVLYVRKDKQGRGMSDEKILSPHSQRKNRFLIDLNLSRLGSIQLDGLVGSRNLDLVLRSEAPLPVTMRDELKVMYERTMKAFGYAGMLQFQTERSRWVMFRKTSAGQPITT